MEWTERGHCAETEGAEMGGLGRGQRRLGRGGGEGVIRVRCYPPAGVLSAFDAVDEL